MLRAEYRGKEAALKLLATPFANLTQEQQQRVAQELQRIQGLQHGRIVQVNEGPRGLRLFSTLNPQESCPRAP